MKITELPLLGEWSPATGAPGAISGSISTEQPRQETIASGAVVQPVVTVVGAGGGGSGFGLGPYLWKKIPAVTGVCKTQQRKQHSEMSGDAIDVELELVTAVLLATA